MNTRPSVKAGVFLCKGDIMAALQGTKRVWKQESEFKNMADAELVQQEIDYVASQDVNGKCKNQDLVDYARNNPSSETVDQG